MGILYTHFGRHHHLFQELDRQLPQRETPYCGLVVGAGLETDILLHECSGRPIFDFQPEDTFSWEPMALLSVLRGKHPESTVTVIDTDERVCARVESQTAVPAHDFFRKLNGYVAEFKAPFSFQDAPPDLIERVNQQLSRRKIANQVTQISRVEVSRGVQVERRDFTQTELPPHDVITMMQSARYMTASGLVARIAKSLARGGVIVTQNSGPGLKSIDFLSGFEPLIKPREWVHSDDEYASEMFEGIYRRL